MTDFTGDPGQLPSPERAAYFLDFDGTLVDIAPTPQSVQVDPALPGHLAALRRLCGDAVAIVSGRPIAEIEGFLPGAAYAVAGEHGTALRLAPDAKIQTTQLDPLPSDWLLAAAQLAAAHPGAVLEAKRHGFALHYRAAPHTRASLQAALKTLVAQDSAGYEMISAKMAWEVRPRGIDKGSAVRMLMEYAPFFGRIPVFVGDDVTDEDGMRAARELGGVGLLVPDVFGDPAGVRAWIAKLVGEDGHI
jgi:trehalose 6-phosphate phosphatase